MTLFADRILAESPGSTAFNVIAKEARAFQEELRTAVVIKADNVAQYLEDYPEIEKKFRNITELDSIAPPFPSFWIEWKPPYSQKQMGALFTQVSREDWEGFEVEKAKWLLQIVIVIQRSLDIEFQPIVIAAALDDQGKMIVSGVQYLDEGEYKTPSDEDIDRDQEFYKTWCPLMNMILAPAYMTIGLLHCKNVVVNEERPLPALLKKWRKKKGKELLRHKTLSVFPMRSVSLSSGAVLNSEKSKHPVHIFRGHFKRYCGGRKLFGRYEGIYWWAAHIRGDVHEGVLTKDYNVKAPASKNLPQRVPQSHS